MSVKINEDILNKSNKLNEFILNRWGKNKNVNDFTLMAYIIENEILEYKCRRCDQDNIWFKKPLTLILDRINNILTDNRIENLRILCPNCYCQLRQKMPLFKKMIKDTNRYCIDCKCKIKNKTISTKNKDGKYYAPRNRCNKCIEKQLRNNTDIMTVKTI